MRYISGFFLTPILLLAVLISTNVTAGVIYDEGVDGDTTLWWTSFPTTDLGSVASGDVILGTVDNVGNDSYGENSYWDGYRFDLDGSFDSITIDWLAGTIPNNGWQLYGAGSNTYLEWTYLSAGNLSITFDISGLTGADFGLGNNGLSVSLLPYDYQITFGTVPEPSIFALMGLGLLGFVATRRKIQK